MSEERRPNRDDGKDPASRPMSKGQTGESGGGAYPRPEHEASPEAGDFKGGQSNQAYYGKGQLGDKELDGNENAPLTEQ